MMRIYDWRSSIWLVISEFIEIIIRYQCLGFSFTTLNCHVNQSLSIIFELHVQFCASLCLKIIVVSNHITRILRSRNNLLTNFT